MVMGMGAIDYCQSCGMPLAGADDLLGSNADQSLNSDYCKMCYVDGSFTADLSLEEMIEICVPHVVDASRNMSEDEVRSMLQEFLPTLKRWK